jgi:hypothetical protein
VNAGEEDVREPIEATARDVAVHVERERGFSSGKRLANPARIQEDASELRIAGRCKSVERHGAAIQLHRRRHITAQET